MILFKRELNFKTVIDTQVILIIVFLNTRFSFGIIW